ncbi:formin-like protein 5 [Spodoptera litura]|uniref:Formin-like protein 5 n=1 Tax=Spodoptera litura TaxID=69820 RepID=A0A9J7IZV8_SPOLT|nr:formin-like protein 5 [Spodoptera litura]
MYPEESGFQARPPRNLFLTPPGVIGRLGFIPPPPPPPRLRNGTSGFGLLPGLLPGDQTRTPPGDDRGPHPASAPTPPLATGQVPLTAVTPSPPKSPRRFSSPPKSPPSEDQAPSPPPSSDDLSSDDQEFKVVQGKRKKKPSSSVPVTKAKKAAAPPGIKIVVPTVGRLQGFKRPSDREKRPLPLVHSQGRPPRPGGLQEHPNGNL